MVSINRRVSIFARAVFLVALIVALLLLGGAAAYALTYSGDITSTSYAINDSAASGQPATNSVDDNISTFWETNTVAASCVASAAYIGQDFGSGVTKDVRRIWVYTAATSRGITSAIVQYSDNGSGWSAAETITLTNDANNHAYELSEHGGHRYWRLVCNSTPSGAWRVNELEMNEVLTDTPTPTTAAATATITPTPSTTPSPTPNYFIEVTSTLGPPMHFENRADIGQVFICGGQMLIGGLGLIAFSIWFWQRRPDGS